jgi:mycothiol synthase
MDVRVGVAPREGWSSAARAVFAHLPDPADAAGRLVALLRSDEIDSAGLFVAKDERGKTLGATLAVVSPGAQGQLLPPYAANDVEDLLVAEACRWLASRGIKVIQVTLPDNEAHRGASLYRCGFKRVTRLVQYGIPAAGEKRPAESKYHLRPHTDAEPQAFADALVSASTDSKDCPELDGARTPEEIVEGYRSAAGPAPWWFYAEAGHRPAGVLLLAAGDDPAECEIVFLGVVPGFRRKGVGTFLTRAAVGLAGERGTDRLTVGVDERNAPAVGLYEGLGFVRLGRTDVYLKIENP